MKKIFIISISLLLFPLVALAQSVREQHGSVEIYFHAGKTEIDGSYKDNYKSLNEFAEIINSCKDDRNANIGIISIKSSTSPEGSKALNDRLAEERAQAITEWLKARTSAKLIYKIEAKRTDWEVLIAAVESSNEVPNKQEVLNILHNVPEFVERDGRVIESRLNSLKKLSVAYNWLLANIFPQMRYASALTTIQWEPEIVPVIAIKTESPINFPYIGGNGSVHFEKNVATDILPTATCEASWITLTKPTMSGADFVVAENPTFESRSTTVVLHYNGVDYPVVVNQEPAPTPVEEPAPAEPEKKPFYMAIKTNMLYDLITIPNASVEFHLGKRFSLTAGYAHAWWKKEERNFFFRYYGADASFRWWFGKHSKVKPLQGHHIGVNYQILTYDFQFGGQGLLAGKPGGMLIDRPNHTIALEYGFSLPIARRLNLDFVIAGGYNWGIFDEYIPVDGHYVWQSTKNRRYFGPTKLEVSLVWLIGRGNYNKDKGKEAKR